MSHIITIDGPAGSGKSTVSRLLAKKLGFTYLDTGAMYRAVALMAWRKGMDVGNGKKLYGLCKSIDINFLSRGDSPRVYIGSEDVSEEIRRPEMDMLSSKISMIKEVRDAMTDLQRNIGKKGRIVAEGRDMGTIVFPDAGYKFFLTASPQVRAERRHAERVYRGDPASMENIENELRIRDEQDSQRSIAPLKPAEGAIIIDTSALDIDQVVEKVLSYIPKTVPDRHP
jgi:cytidylate kinase